MKSRACTLAVIAFLIGSLASALCLAQDITVSSANDIKVGRQKVLTISAEKDGIPADSILIDVQGELDYQIFENNSKFCFVPTKAGEIRLKVVAVWFDLKIAEQTIQTVQAASAVDQKPPFRPVPDSGLEGVSEAVSKASKALNDPNTAKALSEAYSGLSDALKTKSSYKQSYFGNNYEYDLQNDYKSEINLAISRTISKCKAESQLADSANWEAVLLEIKKLSNDHNLDDRAVMSAFLNAVAEGLS